MATFKSNIRSSMAPAGQLNASNIVKYVRTPIGDIGLSLERMRRLEREYLDEAAELRGRIVQYSGIVDGRETVYEKTLAPFQYWLENRCAIWARKNQNEKGGFLPKRDWTGEP
jgi:hypothetical protein